MLTQSDNLLIAYRYLDASAGQVPEKALWHIKVQCFGSTNSWTHLAKLAAEKKPPIGYKPFALACIKHKQPVGEVEKYVDKMTAAEERYNLYSELGLWRKAFECASKIRDAQSSARFQEILQGCRDEQLVRAVQEHIAKS